MLYKSSFKYIDAIYFLSLGDNRFFVHKTNDTQKTIWFYGKQADNMSTSFWTAREDTTTTRTLRLTAYVSLVQFSVIRNFSWSNKLLVLSMSAVPSYIPIFFCVLLCSCIVSYLWSNVRSGLFFVSEMND